MSDNTPLQSIDLNKLDLPVAVFALNGEGQLCDGLQNLFALLGPVRGKEGNAVDLSELLLPDQIEKWQGIWAEIQAGRKVGRTELKFRSTFSDSITLLMSFCGRHGADPIRVAALDTSLQKGLAYALEAAEERFNVLFRESSDPMIILSMKGEILSVNPAFEKASGILSHELFRGEREWGDFIHKEDLAHVLHGISGLAQAEKDITVEFRMHTVREEGIWYEMNMSLLHNEEGGVRGVMAVARDITDRKERERKLMYEAELMQRRHEQAQSMVDKLKRYFTETSSLPYEVEGFLNGVCNTLFYMYKPLAVMIKIDNGNRIFYRTRTSLPADVFGPDGCLRHSAMYNEVIHRGSPLYSNRLQSEKMYSRDRAVRQLNLFTYLGAPLRDPVGEICGTLSIIDDEVRHFDSLDVELITVAALNIISRLIEEGQEEARRELEMHVRQMQKMEAVGMLAGGIAHDFNNHLSGILGFASFTKKGLNKKSMAYKNLVLIEKSAQSASELTRQLLSFARHRDFAKEPVSMNTIIHDVLQLLRHSLSKKIKVDQSGVRDVPTVMGDYGQLNQVIMNLCLNAGDAMNERGGELRLASEYRPLSERERSVLPAALEDQYICIEIQDSGRGISPEVQKHIFDPFFTTKSTRGGTGLGLSIVYGVVTNHDGFITVDSEENVGTRFTVYFPAFLGEVVKKKPIDHVEAGKGGGETVLVVDDEERVRVMVVQILKHSGYRLFEAANGREAIEIFEKEGDTIDLVFLDMIMPELDGPGTFYALKKMQPDVMVLLTSGYAQQGKADELLSAGAKNIIYKPYTSDDLIRAVQGVLSR